MDSVSEEAFARDVLRICMKIQDIHAIQTAHIFLTVILDTNTMMMTVRVKMEKFSASHVILDTIQAVIINHAFEMFQESAQLQFQDA